MGYGVDLTNNVTAGIDFEWANNSVHEFIPLNIGNNQALLGAQRLHLPQKARDDPLVGGADPTRQPIEQDVLVLLDETRRRQ